MNCLSLLRHLLLLVGCLGIFTAGHTQPSGKVYTGNYLQSLRIPIGGIGTGDVLMGGRANIEHVEVFNRPDRVRRLEKTFFALWTKKGTDPPVSKILEREIFPPYLESTHKYVAGLPRLRSAEFINNFPNAHWRFQDDDVPLEISMEAFNPFIPLDVENSSWPVIAFYWNLENNSNAPVEGSLVFNMENPIQAEEIVNEYHRDEKVQGIRFTSREEAPVNYRGSLFMGTTADEVIAQTHWFPGEWRDETHLFWDDFSRDGMIDSRLSDWNTTYAPTSYNETTRRMASVLVPFSLEPGEQVRIPFYLAWYFPVREFRNSEVFGIEEAAQKPFKNAYGVRFADEQDALNKFLRRETELYGLTGRFGGIIHSSTYPESVREALVTQAATLRTNLIQVTAEGNVHGFEGVLSQGWCCPGTCTHVWNYEQTLASLFPSLERKMREIEFLHDTFENGFQTHRSVLPLGDYWFNGPAAADGQMGTIVRAYREWKLSGDEAWLARLWPKIKKALEFAWYGPGEIKEARFKFQESQMAWDPDKRGILSGRQHNTYDINFFGPSSMTTSLYLAALKACAEMAEAMGETDKAGEYREVYRRGTAIAEDSLWNGSYFVQIVAEDPQSPPTEASEKWLGDNKMPKYQYGNGCLSDQLLGQYLAFISGLGYIMDSVKVMRAIRSVYDHNFIRSLREFANVQRVFGLNEEAGVVLCTWPEGDRPALPFVYSDEIWTGVEFQVAASLIYAGFTKEGLEIVEAVQNRYDGFKRNPFEHDESGVHYARAMAGWSLLLALSGVDYDGKRHSLSFDPRMNLSRFSTFWSTNEAWGQLKIENGKALLSIAYGKLELKRFAVGDKLVESFPTARTLSTGDRLTFDLD